MSLAVVEPEIEPFDPQIYFPEKLAGIVHFIGELRQDRQSRALIMPNGSVEIAFFLERDQTTEFYLGDDSPSDRTQRNEFSLVFSVANRPQIVAGRRIHVILAMMTPAAAMLIFGIPASELANRTVAPMHLGIDVRPLEDILKTLPNFTVRARAIESWLATRLRAAEGVPEFLSFRRKFVDLFRDGRKVPEVDQMMDLTGYSGAHANRLAKQWLGTSLSRHASLRRYRKALELLNGPMSLAEVAAEAGYFDQAHFTHRFIEYSGISPGQYRLTPRTGADTLHVA
jgi:AraC-like DNA-binding protein